MDRRPGNRGPEDHPLNRPAWTRDLAPLTSIVVYHLDGDRYARAGRTLRVRRPITTLAWAADSTALVVGTSHSSRDNGEIQVFVEENGRYAEKPFGPQVQHSPALLSVSAGAELIASASIGGTPVLYRRKESEPGYTGRPVTTLESVLDLDLDQDGNLRALASDPRDKGRMAFYKRDETGMREVLALSKWDGIRGARRHSETLDGSVLVSHTRDSLLIFRRVVFRVQRHKRSSAAFALLEQRRDVRAVPRGCEALSQVVEHMHDRSLLRRTHAEARA